MAFRVRLAARLHCKDAAVYKQWKLQCTSTSVDTILKNGTDLFSFSVIVYYHRFLAWDSADEIVAEALKPHKKLRLALFSKAAIPGPNRLTLLSSVQSVQDHSLRIG